MTVLRQLRRLSSALDALLDEQGSLNRRQLQEVREKTRKLKKRCKELASILAELEESGARQALAHEYELALALRRKAHDKYHSLKRQRRH